MVNLLPQQIQTQGSPSDQFSRLQSVPQLSLCIVAQMGQRSCRLCNVRGAKPQREVGRRWHVSSWTRKTRHVGPPASDLRKVDQDPARFGKKSQPKRFGFTVESNHWNTKEWTRRIHSWYQTEAARDQALESFKRKLGGWQGRWYRDPQPIDRQPPTDPGERVRDLASHSSTRSLIGSTESIGWK